MMLVRKWRVGWVEGRGMIQRLSDSFKAPTLIAFILELVYPLPYGHIFTLHTLNPHTSSVGQLFAPLNVESLFLLLRVKTISSPPLSPS